MAGKQWPHPPGWDERQRAAQKIHPRFTQGALEIEGALEILCSCGKTAVIRPDERGVYSCEDPSWRYSGSDDGDRLWNCGQPLHFQARVRDAMADPRFVRALSLRAQAMGKLEAFEVVSGYLHADQDPGLATRLGALWREASRLAASAADLIDPREAETADDPLRELFR